MKASLRLPPSSFTSKVDDRNWTREVWLASYRQSRAQIREGGGLGRGARSVWCLGHLRRRFGASGWFIAQQAARVAFDAGAVSKAATGSAEELARQGMLSRAVRVERAPRGGWCWAWTFDDLGSPNTARSLRRLRARRLRDRRAEDAARRRLVAAGMAADRLVRAVGPVEERFGLTMTGLLALREAEAARATA